MKTLTTQELRSIEQFFQLKQPALLKAMKQYLKTKYEKVICTKDYIIAVGDIPIGLVAHLDTVFNSPPKNIYYDREKNVMWSPEGLGADDRAGVYSIVQIVKSGYRPTIIFTTDEELGCKGAGKLVKEIGEAPTALNYIIQLDRRGSDDCVFYECDFPEFEEYIESFGFVTNFGTFSDISIICPAWKVAGVNLSIGYYNEHTLVEILNIGQMISTTTKVKKMLEKACELSKPFEYKTLEYDDFISNKSLFNDSQDYLGFGIPNFHNNYDLSRCHVCKTADFDYNLFPVETENGELINLCVDCFGTRNDISWCDHCGKAFISEDGNDTICKNCESKNK